MNYRILLLPIMLTSQIDAADLALNGWVESNIRGQTEETKTKSYTRAIALNGFDIRMQVIHAYSPKIDNLVQEIEIKPSDHTDDKWTHIARCVSSDGGFYYFLNSDNAKFQVFAGIAGRDGCYFASQGQRFVNVIPKDAGDDADYFVLSFISDENNVYHPYDKADYNKYNRHKK